MSRQVAWLLRPPPADGAGLAGMRSGPVADAPAGKQVSGRGARKRKPEAVTPPAGLGSVPAADGSEGARSKGERPRPEADVPAGTPVSARRRRVRAPTPPPLPSREEVQALPPFESLGDEAIRVVGAARAQEVAGEILVAGVVGFDTESRPVFVRGQTQDGPHLVQFAVADRAWLFSLMDPACAEAVGGLLATPSLWKVGFGLAGDRALLERRFGQVPAGLIDLDQVYRRQGYRASLGIRMAVAVTFGRHFRKSKAIGTSDWSRQPLSEAQCRYAAHDAWGAFRVYQALLGQGLDIRPD